MAARRLGEDEAYLTVRDILSEASTVADGVLSHERSGFYRCGSATLGLTTCSVDMTSMFRAENIGIQIGDPLLAFLSYTKIS